MVEETSGATGRPHAGDVVLYLVAVAGLSGALTIVWLSMRAVMNVGGTCASGGPYVIDVPCPDGVPVLLTLGIFALFGFGGLMIWRGARLGGPYPGLVALAWPALFLSLGWNFLEYAFAPPDDSGGIVWGWLIPGVVFVVMGGAPLIGALSVGRTTMPRTPGAAGAAARLRSATRGQAATLARPNVLAPAGGGEATLRPSVAPGRASVAADPDAAEELVSRLERLAALHRSGALTDEEFAAAKLELLTRPDEP